MTSFHLDHRLHPDAPTIYHGDHLKLDAGEVLCGNPSQVDALDTLLAGHVPDLAVIEPPNGRHGYDLLTYLATLRVKYILCWDAERYKSAILICNRGSWLTWDFSAPGGQWNLGRSAFLYGIKQPSPGIIRSLESEKPNYYGRRATTRAVTQAILLPVVHALNPDSNVNFPRLITRDRTRTALVCYDPAYGATTEALQDLGFYVKGMDPEPALVAEMAIRLTAR